MTIGPFTAARTACKVSGWSLSNLALHKILYLAHMAYLGETGERLISEPFEAWHYGPVLPSVYHQAKAFGAGPVRDVFHRAGELPLDSPEYRKIEKAVKALGKRAPGDLVSITHDSLGAWGRVYDPKVRGTPIPDAEILEEFGRRSPKR